MLNPWLTLGMGAFAISLVISLMMTRDLGGSIVTGSLAMATAFLTAATVNWYHNRAADSRIATLKQQIRLLQRRRAEEQQAVLEISAEKERAAMSLTSMQEQLRQRQLPGSLPFARSTLSWDLSSQGYANADVESDPQEDSDELNQFIADATATRQKINASLNHLQAELSQLNAQINDQQTVREQLVQDIHRLTDQKQELILKITTLETEIESLERCRIELDHYIAYVEAKKQELESGTNPLQKALKQLQEQVNALQAELSQLEGDVTVKRKEKESLERELADAKHQKNVVKPLQESVKVLEAQKAELERSLLVLTQQQETLQNTQEHLKTLEDQQSELERSIVDLQQQQDALKATQENLQNLELQKNQLEQDLANLKQDQEGLQSVQDNLQKLENQLSDRRKEKESLERQITQLQAQKTSLRHQTSPANDPWSKEPSSKKQTSRKHIAEEQLRLATDNQRKAKPTSEQRSGKAKSTVTSNSESSAQVKPEINQGNSAPHQTEQDQELSDVWTDFMLQLPEYELQALKAIAQESNSTRLINRIAEANFVTADELVDSINQLAEAIVGEPVVKSRSNFSPPVIFRDHVKTIKKLIKTYEYLAQ